MKKAIADRLDEMFVDIPYCLCKNLAEDLNQNNELK